MHIYGVEKPISCCTEAQISKAGVGRITDAKSLGGKPGNSTTMTGKRLPQRAKGKRRFQLEIAAAGYTQELAITARILKGVIRSPPQFFSSS